VVLVIIFIIVVILVVVIVVIVIVVVVTTMFIFIKVIVIVSMLLCINGLNKRSSINSINKRNFNSIIRRCSSNSNIIETLIYNDGSDNSNDNSDIMMLIKTRNITNVITNGNDNAITWSASRDDIQLDSTILEPQYLSGHSN